MIKVLVCLALLVSSSTANKGSRRFESKPKPILVDLDAIRLVKYSDYSKLMSMTLPEYRGYAASPAGSEHYALLSYFASIFSKSHTSFVDIGTRFGTSALTLASHGHHVITYDRPQSGELPGAMKSLKMTPEKWHENILNLNCSVTVLRVDILTLSEEDFDLIRHSSLILLDTFHRPYKTPFEREFLTKLSLSRYSGVVLLDDIYEHEEMIRWWTEIVCSKYRSFQIYDLTSVGHATGTGLLDFGNRIHFAGEGRENVIVRSDDPKYNCPA
jgi:predicted O-methyltransferase YrrM